MDTDQDRDEVFAAAGVDRPDRWLMLSVWDRERGTERHVHAARRGDTVEVIGDEGDGELAAMLGRLLDG